MTGFELYLILMLDNIKDLLSPIFAFSVISFFACSVALVIAMAEEQEDFVLNFKKAYKIIILTAIVSSLLLAVVPNTKQMATIYLLPKLVNNEEVQAIAGDSLKILKELTSKTLCELTDCEKEQHGSE